MVQGKVKWVNAATGFGCITIEESNTDLFVSLSSVAFDLKETQKVFLEIQNNGLLKQAVNICPCE